MPVMTHHLRSYVAFALAAVLSAPSNPVAANESGDQAGSAESASNGPAEMSEGEKLETLGRMLAQRGGATSLKLGRSALETMSEGMEMTLEGRMQALVDSFRQERLRAIEQGEDDLPELNEDALRALSYFTVAQSGLQQLEFSDEEVDRIVKGFVDGGLAGEGAGGAMQAKAEAVGSYLQKRAQKTRKDRMKRRQEAMKRQRETQKTSKEDVEKNKKAGREFIASMEAKHDDVKATDSGLHYRILEEGEGERPDKKDTVKLHYVGKLPDGTVFDSSRDRGEPATFPLDGVVPGFAEGLTQVREGGQAELYIPSDLAYGDSGRPPRIPGGSTLVFEVEVLEVNP